VTLNPNARHRRAALEVLRAVSRDEFYLAMMEEFGYVPPKPALLDTRAAGNIEVMGRYVDTMKFAGEHAVPRPVSVVWPRESPRIAQRVSATFAGEQAPGPAMAALKEDLVQIEESVGEAGG
jgi:ABC-type glycerol-3-phosphate transport system substrate-binding protein